MGGETSETLAEIEKKLELLSSRLTTSTSNLENLRVSMISLYRSIENQKKVHGDLQYRVGLLKNQIALLDQ